MKARQIIIILGAVGVILGAIGISQILASFKPEEVKEEKKAPKRYIQAEAIKYKTISSEVNATGRLLSFNEFDLSTEVGGQLRQGSVVLKKGQAFSRGQIIAKVFNEEAIYALKARKSRFLNSIANILPDLKIDYKDSFDKWQSFFNSINIDKKLPELPKPSSSQEKIFLATRNILSDYYTIKAEEVRLDKYSLVAPFDGTFSDVYLEIGSTVNTGSRIARLIQTTALELEIPVEISFAQWINVGDAVKIYDNDKKMEWEAKVVRKSKFVDEQTQSISIFARISTKKGQPLFKGQYMFAAFPGIALDGVMEIPRNAIYNNNSVFIVKEGKLKKRAINVKKFNETTALFSGLPEGEMVVTEPIVNAKEGDAVRIIGIDEPEEEKADEDSTKVEQE